VLRLIHIARLRGRLLLGLALLCAVRGWATAPQLASISPAGAQRGTELEMTFKGERLQDAEEIICYEPGVQVLALNSITNQMVKARVKITPDCDLGEHHLRVRTGTGISELRTFHVGPYPALDEVEPNNDRAKPQKVSLNTAIAGTITSEDVDYFSIELKQGQRFSAEVLGIRLGRANFDPRLTVFDQHDQIVADAEDTWLGMQDPFLSFNAPSNGTYIIQVRDVTYGGNDNSQYLLYVGSFPRPQSAYPLGGKAGEKVAFAFRSDPTGWFTNVIQLPASTEERLGVYPHMDGLLAPSPNWIRVSSFPNVMATGTNHTREMAAITDLHPPIALNGIIAEKAQEDWFRFPAVKGQLLEAHVYSRKLRSPLDSVIEVFDVAGKSLASDDDASGVDSLVKFTPAESTNYFIRIRDTFGKGGPDFAYRIEVAPPKPQIQVKIPEVARNDTQSRQSISVPRGNRFATLLSVKRANVDSDVSLRMEGLPQGMTMLAEKMPAKIDSMPLVLEAAADAPVGSRLIDLAAVGTNSQGEVVGHWRQNVELVQGSPNNAVYYGTSVDKIAVAVTKEAPFRLRILEPSVPLVQAGSMKLEVIADRTNRFDEPIELNMVWNPPGVTSQSEATIPKGATNVFYQLNANGGAEIRGWKIAILGHALVDGGQVYVSTQPAKLDVSSPFVTGKMEALWLSPGKSGKLTVNLQQQKPFEGKAKIRIVGLPEHVIAPEKEISSTDQEVVFDVAADDKCPLGSHKNLFCALDVKQGEDLIPHVIATGGILRIVPPKKTTTVAAQK
jgi:hypothetical protein